MQISALRGLGLQTGNEGHLSSSIGKDTFDEASFAYRGMEEIQDAVTDTVEIERILRPVYYFKAGNTEG